MALRFDKRYSETVGMSCLAVSSSRSHSNTYRSPCRAPMRLGKWVLRRVVSSRRHTGSAMTLSWECIEQENTSDKVKELRLILPGNKPESTDHAQYSGRFADGRH